MFRRLLAMLFACAVLWAGQAWLAPEHADAQPAAAVETFQSHADAACDAPECMAGAQVAHAAFVNPPRPVFVDGRGHVNPVLDGLQRPPRAV